MLKSAVTWRSAMCYNLLTFRVYDMDIVLSYYTSLNLYQARRRHIPADGTLRSHCTQKTQIS